MIWCGSRACGRRLFLVIWSLSILRKEVFWFWLGLRSFWRGFLVSFYFFVCEMGTFIFVYWGCWVFREVRNVKVFYFLRIFIFGWILFFFRFEFLGEWFFYLIVFMFMVVKERRNLVFFFVWFIYLWFI